LCSLKQIWSDNFYKRNEKWGTNWTKEELYISRDDIITISAATDLIKTHKVNGKDVPMNFVEVLEWQKLVALDKPLKLREKSTKSYDLIYGGFYRGGKRHKQMFKYFHDVPYKAKFFGKIEAKHFEKDKHSNPPVYLKESKGWEFFKEQTNNSLATIIFAEEEYCDNIITMRVYASILSNTIVFIENSYDTLHKIFPDDIFHGFNYVKDHVDLAKKLEVVKSFTDEQYDEYCKKQLEMLKCYGAELIFEEFDSILKKYIYN